MPGGGHPRVGVQAWARQICKTLLTPLFAGKLTGFGYFRLSAWTSSFQKPNRKLN